MLNVGLSGCNGTMGRIIHDLLLEQENVQVVFGIDIEPERYENDYPVFTDPYEINVDCDVIIDFSHPNNLDDILAYAKRIKQKLFSQQLVFLRNN